MKDRMTCRRWEGLDPPYATIVADPPWRYDERRLITTARTYKPAADKRYSTMSVEEIAALPVSALAAANAHLYLWATTPRLFGHDGSGRRGLGPVDVLEAWGFRYITTITWAKIGTLGMGYHFRGVTEHVLFGTRGEAPIPPEDRLPNLIVARKVGHSIKPGALFDVAEQVSPEPRVELFCRQPRFGWDSWGLGYEHAV